MSSNSQQQKQSKPQMKLTKKQLAHQIQTLNHMVQENRHIVYSLGGRMESQMIQQVSLWETMLHILTEELGLDEGHVNQIMADKYTANIEKHKQMMDEHQAELEAQATAQAEELTEQAEAYLKEQGIDVDAIQESYQEELTSLEEDTEELEDLTAE